MFRLINKQTCSLQETRIELFHASSPKGRHRSLRTPNGVGLSAERGESVERSNSVRIYLQIRDGNRQSLANRLPKEIPTAP
jgi:hypothetical protein